MKPPKGPDNKFSFSFPQPVLLLHPKLFCTSKAPSPQRSSLARSRAASMGTGRLRAPSSLLAECNRLSTWVTVLWVKAHFKNTLSQ